MIVDGRTVASNTYITSDICIIGAGPAGITLALELKDTFDDIVLLESGGESPDARTQRLYAGDNVGVNYASLERVRSRFLGGSSNCWAGWCRPLDPIDFEKRDWIPNSGWPFDRQELEPFYIRAHEYLGLGPFDYTEATWQNELRRRRLRTFKLDGTQFHNQLVQFSPPTRFGTAYKTELEQSSTIKLLTWSNACEIETSAAPVRALGVKVRTFGGNVFHIGARHFILASGGIENARLLLYSHEVCGNNIGSSPDIVGRYFMDHPKIRSSTFIINDQAAYRRLYDSTVAGTRHKSGQNPNAIAAHVAPTPALQRQLELPNSRTYLVGRYAFEESDSFRAVMAARMRSLEKRRYGETDIVKWSYSAIAKSVMQQPLGVVAVLDKTINGSRNSRRFTLETVIEPIPNRDSKVSLIGDRDENGVNKISLDWKITNQDTRNIEKTVEMLKSQIVDQHIGEAVDDLQGQSEEPFVGCWHHMGTTRMSESPKHGVVDKNLQVHGVQNLFCLGSSVFPTAGSDCPTITLVALALRLSDRLKAAQRQARS